MRLFYLKRMIDDSGVSGVGFVAEGTVYDDGVCSLHWMSGEIHSTTIYNNIQEVEKIHGHNGHTMIEWTKSEEVK